MRQWADRVAARTLVWLSLDSNQHARPLLIHPKQQKYHQERWINTAMGTDCCCRGGYSSRGVSNDAPDTALAVPLQR